MKLISYIYLFYLFVLEFVEMFHSVKVPDETDLKKSLEGGLLLIMYISYIYSFLIIYL